MILKRLVLKNWKNFRDVDVKFSERAFIVGANASGKSNLLDALRFLRDIVKQAGGLQYAVESRGGITKIRCLAARKVSTISIEIHLSNNFKDKISWIYKLTIAHVGGGIRPSEAKIIEESVWSSKAKKYILQRNENSKNEDEETVKFTKLEQVSANSEFREIYSYLKDIRYLHIVPQLIRDSDSYILSSVKEDYYGRTLLDKISITNEKTKNSYLKKINETLVVAVPQLKELSFIKDKMGIPHFQVVCQHWRFKGVKQQETQFSDGTLRLIGFLWALLESNELVLMEEPELYLHAAIVRKLPQFIAKLQKKKSKTTQVILSTHSFDLLSDEGIGSDEVILLKTTPEGTEVKAVEQLDDAKNYLESGFSMAETVLPMVAPTNIESMLDFKD